MFFETLIQVRSVIWTLAMVVLIRLNPGIIKQVDHLSQSSLCLRYLDCRFRFSGQLRRLRDRRIEPKWVSLAVQLKPGRIEFRLTGLKVSCVALPQVDASVTVDGIVEDPHKTVGQCGHSASILDSSVLAIYS